MDKYMENEDKNILLLDEELSPIIMEEKCAEMKPIVEDFVESYVQNQDKPIEEWLGAKLQESLPEKTPEEIRNITDAIVSTLNKTEEKKQSLNNAIKIGRSKESWFASETQKTVSTMSMQETVEYLSDLDGALNHANEAMQRTIMTKEGVVSQCKNLDGFIAEQYHAQTFNLNAEATGSPYRAKVLEPNGKGYAKNSVDIVIEDGNGKIVRRYQSKYCQDAKATQNAFESGNYRGQQSLVSDGQQNDISRKCTTVLEAPDGTTSKPLSKENAKQMQRDAQGGTWKETNWNEYRTKDVAKGIAKSAGSASVQGMVIGTGFTIAQKLFTGEDIEGEELVETALVCGTDSGIKAAATGAIKVGAEKEILPALFSEVSVAGSVAFIGIENAKVIGKMMSGELSGKECVEKMEQTTVAAMVGLSSMAEGTAVGAAAGAVFGPVGSAIGGFIGGTVSYMAGSKIGEMFVKGVQKVGHALWEGAKAVVSGIADFASEVVSFFLW